MISFEELKERKLVHWGLAYLAAAWVLLQVLTLMHQNFAWPPFVIRAVTVVLAVGFLAALVLAWYHGEKGEQRVGKVELLMLTGIFLIAGVGVAILGEEDPIPAAEAASGGDAVPDLLAEQGSIAVLPFENMSADEDNEYFSDGLSEELLNVLAQLPELRVASRTSAFAFEDKDVGIDSIARTLNVRHVLEGSVRKAGDQVRITAQLIDASSGYHLWSETYDRTLSDVFAIQDEIARAIVNQLQIELSGGRDQGQLAEVETTDAEAHTLVLRARQTVYQGSGEPSTWLLPAERLFEAAIVRDSGYAAAWAGLANVHRLQASYGLTPADAGLEQARTEAERALALDPGAGDAHIVLGLLTAESSARGAHFEQALRANPGDARTLGYYGRWLQREGRTEEALRATRRAVELDPLSIPVLSIAGGVYQLSWDLANAAKMFERTRDLAPDDPYLLYNLGMTRVLLGEREAALRLAERVLEVAPRSASVVGQTAWIYAYARDFGRAVELYRRAIELAPDDPVSLADLANALVMVGEPEEAVKLAERAVELAPESEHLQVIRAYAYAKAERPEAARSALSELPADEYLFRAAVHAALGEKDPAFALLDRAVEEREPGLEQLGADWWFDSLRGDPRMDSLLRRIGVPDVASPG